MTTIFRNREPGPGSHRARVLVGRLRLVPSMTFKAGHLVDPNDRIPSREVRELTPALVMDDVRAATR